MIVALDFETHYSSEYSLSKMSEVDYILDPRFQTIMCAVKEGAGPSEVFVGHAAVARRLAQIDWSRAAALAHNMRFDGAILLWRFGHAPALYLDTLAMARALTHAVIGKSSLARLSEYFGLPAKGDEVVKALGKRLEDFSRPELAAYAIYCQRDNDNCRALFDRMMRRFPKAELPVIDLSLRMFIEPQAKLAAPALEAHLAAVRAEKEAVMTKVAHIDRAVFSSNQKFAALLESRGVEAPRKISPTTGLETWALARNDRAFKDLCQDASQPMEVQAILAARINAKSTIEETRTEKLLNLARRDWSVRGRGWMPVPLRFCGAHTGRFSGDGGFNFQNLKRASGIKVAIAAPPGWRIVHRDSSQIEARMVAFLANCVKLLRAFEQGRDVYSEFASLVYQRRITKADKLERFVGKTSILGLGYGMGALRFKHTLYIGQGGISVDMAEDDAAAIVREYRSTYREIQQLWSRAHYTLHDMLDLSAPKLIGQKRGVGPAGDLARRRPLPVVAYTANAIWLPNGLPITYPRLHEMRTVSDTGEPKTEIFYLDPYDERKKLFGGKVVENVSQALARIVITDVMVRVRAETGFHPMLMTHDSVDYVVPEEDATWWDDYLQHQFSIRPAWAMELPLASEGGWGRTLLEAERHANV